MSTVCLVVPCYNEEERLDVEAFTRALEAQPELEFIFVDDGSVDGTLRVLEQVAQREPERVVVMSRPENAGKAEAVRQGMLRAMAGGSNFVGYWDADLASPLSELNALVEAMERSSEVEFVLGARVAMLGRRIERSPLRHYLGRVFATGASLALDLVVYDTQCGAKLMRNDPELRPLFEDAFRTGWSFDVELLARYLRLRGSERGLLETPLWSWEDVPGSSVRPWDFVRALLDLTIIRRAYPRPRR